MTFQSVTIGNIRLVGASAELVAAYSPLVASIARSERTWMIGCLDTVIGYWPTREMLREGGYEVVGHCNLFGLTSLTSNVEEEVLDGFRRVCG